MKKLGIIGLGVIGKATYNAFTVHGHELMGYDIKIPETDPWEDIVGVTDAVFICTPENAASTVVRRLVTDKYDGMIIIRSTVPPGTTISLENSLNRRVIHNPEFLRERFSMQEALMPRLIVIGATDRATAQPLVELYTPFARPIQLVTPTESEMLKLWWNAKLACNISFANSMKQICDRVGADSHLINNIVSQFPLYEGHPWFIGQKLGGKCLPKDLTGLIKFADDNAVPVPLLKAIRDVNEAL